MKQYAKPKITMKRVYKVRYMISQHTTAPLQKMLATWFKSLHTFIPYCQLNLLTNNQACWCKTYHSLSCSVVFPMVL